MKKFKAMKFWVGGHEFSTKTIINILENIGYTNFEKNQTVTPANIILASTGGKYFVLYDGNQYTFKDLQYKEINIGWMRDNEIGVDQDLSPESAIPKAGITLEDKSEQDITESEYFYKSIKEMSERLDKIEKQLLQHSEPNRIDIRTIVSNIESLNDKMLENRKRMKEEQRKQRRTNETVKYSLERGRNNFGELTEKLNYVIYKLKQTNCEVAWE